MILLQMESGCITKKVGEIAGMISLPLCLPRQSPAFWRMVGMATRFTG